MVQSEIKALTFDVFGTVVDWYNTIIEKGNAWGEAKGITVDWVQFALDWRGGYEPAMGRVRRGELPWLNIDALHRMILDELLDKYQITGLSEEEKDHWNRVWHRLVPWPDVLSGLTRLKERYIIAALSNGNIALLTNMAKHSGLPWDCILSSELARHYKPDPEVYQAAADLLGLPSSQVLMVAAHQHDLRGAQAVGMQTAFIPRPLEYGPNNSPDLTPDPSFDWVASDFNELADQLGA
ncbi:haloacid dehalogenase type II [Chloroflexi bacterium TSY]|nr:haloacid dehalogenase type II [Chloroflexi bacterium TSY]